MTSGYSNPVYLIVDSHKAKSGTNYSLASAGLQTPRVRCSYSVNEKPWCGGVGLEYGNKRLRGASPLAIPLTSYWKVSGQIGWPVEPVRGES